MSGMFRRILVPLDGSRLAESVLPLAALLANNMEAQLILLHIVEQSAPARRHGEAHLTSSSGADAYLDAVTAQIGPGVAVEQHVHGTEEVDVAASIASHASELSVDMIALCTHGRSDPRRVLFGSIAQQVLRRAEVPVLLVRPGVPSITALESLLVPLDGSPQAEVALPYAAAIAKSAGASLRLVRVVATVGTVTGDRTAAARLRPLAAAAALDVEELDAQGYLASQVGNMATEGVRASGQVIRGERVHALAGVAAQSDLTVIATHGRVGLDAFWIGSVAAGLVNKLHQPLLLVKVRD